MNRRTVRMPAAVLVAVLSLAGYLWYRLAGTPVLDAPHPRVVADLLDSLAELPPSDIEALVTYNMSAAMDSLEAAVPRRYGDIEQRIAMAGNSHASFGFTVRRSPFRAHIEGPSLRLSTDVEYQGRLWYRPPVGFELSAGCGVGDDPRPRMRATLESTGELTPQWRVRTRTRVLRLEPYSDEPRDRCRMTVLRIDATERVVEATQGMMDVRLANFDRTMSHWPVRAKFEKLWGQLQRPIRLTDDVYLQIRPQAVRLGALGASGDTVTAQLRIEASPRVVAGERPDDVLPLPPLIACSDSLRGSHVVIDGSCTYAVASDLLREVLVGRSLVQGGHRVRIRDVTLSGIGGGRVALGVTLEGDVRGQLYFTGTPSLDHEHHQVNVPDLDYDVGTTQQLVQGLAWLKGTDMLTLLRDRARLPDSAVIGKLRGLAEHGINRRLARGVMLSGRIHDARGTHVRATTHELRVRAVADAEFTLAIDRGPRLPRLRGASGRH